MEISPDHLHSVLAYLQKESSLKMEFLTTMCGLHYPNQKGKELGMMYQVKNLITGYSLRFKTFAAVEEPNIPTITDLYPTANWMERQEYDFFGINFVGHPDLRRILNMDEMDYFPMRKEYKLEDETRDDKEDKFFGR
ncbi:MAG: NADH-quinone oxidoreductase subunit C [Chitinophagales bacterium]